MFPTDAEAREKDGLVCRALPKVGTKVDIEGVGTATVVQTQPAIESQLYGGSLFTSRALPPGFDSGCTLQVQYSDGTTDTVSAAEEPLSVLDEQLPLVVGGLYCALIFSGGSSSEFSSSYEEAGERYEEILTDEDPGAPCAELDAMSGEYWGGSEESDDGDQAIRVSLKFKPDGAIEGRGSDDADGSYRITSGRWKVLADGSILVAWKETYDAGFSAICVGEFDVTTGNIDARFASSREVTGDFSLAKKPAIF